MAKVRNAQRTMHDRLKLQQTWDRIHREEPVSAQPEKDLIAFAEYLQKRLPPQSALLDAGCGRGRNAMYLAQSGFSVCGCDISPLALDVARERTQREDLSIHFQVADLSCLPYADRSFRVVVCVHVLPYHLKADMIKGIRELWRVMQPNGWLYVDLLDPDDAEYGCGQELEEHTFLDPDGTPVHFGSRQEISELFEGFALERVARQQSRSSPARGRVSSTIWAVRHPGVI